MVKLKGVFSNFSFEMPKRRTQRKKEEKTKEKEKSK
jgi:hypothetical protein